MQLAQRITALAQAVGVDIKALFSGLNAKLSLAGGEMTGVQSFAPGMTTSWGGGTLLGPRVLAGSVTAYAANWYRLMSFPSQNGGYAVEFYFAIPGQHVLLKGSFGKTTKSTLYGAGILEVELLASYNYGRAHPYLWRVVDNGTNGQTHIDIRFPNADGSGLAYQIHLLHTMKVAGPDISCPMNSQGAALGTGVTNYGMSMGTGTGEGWTVQKFKLNASNGAYAAEDNTFIRSLGTATAM